MRIETSDGSITIWRHFVIRLVVVPADGNSLRAAAGGAGLSRKARAKVVLKVK
jgi:hypothetical protein